MSKLSSEKFVIGTRRSRLALWQTHFVKAALEERHPGITIEVQEIITRGDTTQAAGIPLPSIGGKGLFTAELEEALRRREIHIAVHSLKDLPTEMESIFTLGAICERESVHDVLISAGGVRLNELPAAAVVGTSSLRRSSQLRRLRGDLRFESIRGNVDTRIAKVRDPGGAYAAAVLAEAGVRRLERTAEVAQVLTLDEMLPAPGQGALAVQCLAEDRATCELLSSIDALETRLATVAERSFLDALNAGCSTPVAAHATLNGGILRFRGRCLSHDGRECIELATEGDARSAADIGRRMADEARRRGFESLQLTDPTDPVVSPRQPS